MDWIIVVFYIILYFAIGGFVNGLFDLQLDYVMIFVWPLSFIILIFLWICDVAEDLGDNIREFLQK